MERIKNLPQDITVMVIGLLIIGLLTLQQLFFKPTFEAFDWGIILLVALMFAGLFVLLRNNQRAAEAQHLKLESQIEERKAALTKQHAELETLNARLQQRQELYRSLVEQVPLAVFQKDRAGRIIEGNERFWESIGYTQVEALGKTDFDIAPRALAEKYRADDVRVMETGVSLEIVQEHQPRRGEMQTVRAIKHPVRDETGAVSGVQVVFWDVSEGRRQNEQIRKLSSAVEQSPTSIVIMNAEGIIEYVNPAFTHITGYALEQVVGTNPRLLKSGQTSTLRFQEMWSTVRAGHIWNGELLNRKKNGDVYWEVVSISPLFNEHGTITHFVEVKQDISQRRLMEVQLRESEKMLAKAQEIAHVGSWRWDMLQDRVQWSDEMFRIFGVARTEFQGNLASILASSIHPADRPRVEESMTRARGGVTNPIEYRIVRPDGQVRVVWAEGELMRDVDDQVVGMVGVAQDITERKHAEDILRRQNAYLDALHATTIDLMGRLDLQELLDGIIHRAIALIDAEHAYIYLLEPGAQKMFMSLAIGTFSQMVGTSAERGSGATGIAWETGQLVKIDDYQMWSQRLSKQSSEPIHSLVSLPLKSGEQVMGVFGVAHTNPHQRFDDAAIEILTRFAHLASVALDNARLYTEAQQEIAERKRAEQAVKQQNEVLQTVFDHSPVMIGMFDAQGRYTLINREWEHTLGYSLEDMNRGEVLHALYPDPAAYQAVREFMFTPTPGWRDFNTRVRTGNDLDTAWTYTLLSNGMTLAFGQDISERKEIDRLKNEFISTVSHELRTPLTSIHGSLGLLVGGVAGPLSERAQSMLDIAFKNSERLVRLINDILDIEKIESGKLVFYFKPIEIASLLAQAVEANRAYGEQLNVKFEITAVPPNLKINADADRMMQVMTNLLSNAAKFSPPHSIVKIGAQRLGANVRVTVRDEGMGIPANFRKEIFEKFAQADTSAARQKSGTGLGLSIAKAIVEKHGGEIGFESREGSGTTFYFTLPVLNAPEPFNASRFDG